MSPSSLNGFRKKLLLLFRRCKMLKCWSCQQLGAMVWMKLCRRCWMQSDDGLVSTFLARFLFCRNSLCEKPFFLNRKSRISTSKLMRWIQQVTWTNPPPPQPVLRRANEHSLPRARDLPVKIKFASQVSTRPPTFALWVNRNRPEHAIEAGYLRFLAKRLKADFDLTGVPVRLLLRSSANPFVTGSFGGSGAKKKTSSASAAQ